MSFRITRKPFTRAFVDISEKNSVLELLPKKNFNVTRGLKPLTDLDDQIVSYSLKTGRPSSCEPKLYDNLEDTLFEKRIAGTYVNPDFYRENELSAMMAESAISHYSNYSVDDVPLALHLEYPDGIDRFLNSYSLDTDLDQRTLDRVSHDYLASDIVPSSFSFVNMSNVPVLNYASLGVGLLKDGFSINRIIEGLQKCILNTGSYKRGIPDLKLFEFLVKNPNERNLAVIVNSKGEEFVDDLAMTYFPIFKKLFPDTQTARDVLKECKTKNKYQTESVDANLARLISFVRRLTATGTTERRIRNNTPWTKPEAELLSGLKQDGRLNLSKFDVAENLLRYDKLPVEIVTANLDEAVKRHERIENIENYLGSNAAKKLINTLRDEFMVQCAELGFKADNSELLGKAEALIKNKDNMSGHDLSEALKALVTV